MEKDIEILESFIKQLEEFEDEEELKQAIENLINRVKELEHQNNILKEKNQDYKCNYNTMAEQKEKAINRVKELEEKQNRLAFKTNSLMNEVITNNIVSKDVIREEIKKLKDMNVEGEVFTTAVNFAIKNLEELLNK